MGSGISLELAKFATRVQKVQPLSFPKERVSTKPKIKDFGTPQIVNDLPEPPKKNKGFASLKPFKRAEKVESPGWRTWGYGVAWSIIRALGARDPGSKGTKFILRRTLFDVNPGSPIYFCNYFDLIKQVFKYKVTLGNKRGGNSWQDIT